MRESDASFASVSARQARLGKPKEPRLGRIVYQRSGKWWTASMPSFPGAYSQGRTQAEAYRSLLLAIKDLIDAYVQLARPAAGRPRPRSAA